MPRQRILHLGKKQYVHTFSNEEDIVLFMKIEWDEGETAFYTYVIKIPKGSSLDLNGEVPANSVLVAYYEPRSALLKDPDNTSDLEARRYEKSRHRPLFQALMRMGTCEERSAEKWDFMQSYRAENVPRRLRDAA